MKPRKPFATLALGLALGVGIMPGLATAQTDHAHDAATVGLTLNNGAKWQGDTAMHKGMDAIRSIMAAALDAIHHGSLTPDAARAIAADVQAQVDFMVGTCVLAPEVDEQLHLVLAQVLEGISELETGVTAGAVKIVQALNAYGTHFEHPGWQPLA